MSTSAGSPREDPSTRRSLATPGTARVGRLAGVSVGLHWSLPVMVALVAGGLAENRFSADTPGRSTATYVVAGILTAIGLMLGVLIHELAHAMVARRRGLTVEDITLNWMGGLTRIQDDNQSPGTELLVAGAGPAASAVLGLLLWLIRMAFTSGGSSGAGSVALDALGWLAWVNVALAAFNLLPAAPLDGGRLVHAVVWRLGHDRWKATRVAAGAGMAVGAAIVVVGLVGVERSGDLFDGLLVGFIGWWMIGAARIELTSGRARRTLEGVLVQDVMRPVGEAPGWLSVRAFVEQYAAARPGWVWLLRDWAGGYGGILLGDSLSRVAYPTWDIARPLDVALPVSAAVAASPGEQVMDVLARAEGHPVILVATPEHTLGAVLAGDMDALVRMRGARGATPGAGNGAWANPR